MASHCNHHHPPPPPLTTTTTNCCCCCCCHNPSYTCSTSPPSHQPSYICCTPLPPQHHLLHAIAPRLSQPQPHPIPISSQHYTKSYTHQNLNFPAKNHYFQHQTDSTISSLLDRIESLESSLNHFNNHSLRHTAARLIQTHFRSFLVRRSRTLSQLKHLASVKSTFNALKSSFSNNTNVDFADTSLKAMNLLLQLDSIQDCDPMIVDGKRSISRDLIQFLDSIEEVALKKRVLYAQAAKTAKSVKKVHRVRNSLDDERRKLLQNLRGRVEKLSKLCKVSANDEEDSELEEGIHDDGVTQNKNGVFLNRQGVQPGVKKSVRFAENRNIYEVYSGDVTCLDGSFSSSDEQGEVLENVSGAVEDDGVDSSQGAVDDEEVLVSGSGGSPRSSDDGERNSRRVLENECRNAVKVKERLQASQEKLLFSAPLPLKMENRSGLKNSKGV